MCFVTIPALIYLAMTPMWTRAIKFANPYAFVVLDALLMVLWFAAAIAVGTWNTAGIKKGVDDNKEKDDKDKKDSKMGCAAFAFGEPVACNVSKAAVGFGVVIFLMFILTTAISVQIIIKYRQTGDLQTAMGTQPGNPASQSIEAQTTDAWSSDTHDLRGDTPGYHRDGSFSDDGTRTERGGGQEEDEYQLLHATETDDGPHPGQYRNWGNPQDKTGASAQPAPPYDDTEYSNPSALSPGGYEGTYGGGGSYDEYRGQARNYNFSGER
ncbi:hypothetical protein P152DRAFT_457881 [Eremomyces bilateralis CBS 781.70]|uniref:MARVEL domain-containing protein n=1 Tax=Eremomyces bilateralis CBS 781.70 TaxID=1392243 RepID=A0A6G1G659_9PEZI|nr:uncharacterized protein P152DRAFT_457881 [Eremomyces bilateralis CBS 781.70]KAF1813518.1 hypothetical protein P152DRAFT_457881 [Eremomyces bilateralis CBS 781.70]